MAAKNKQEPSKNRALQNQAKQPKRGAYLGKNNNGVVSFM